MYEGADTVILYEALAYQDVLPLAWRPSTTPLDAAAQRALADRNQTVLQACVALEATGVADKKEEGAPHAAELLRIETKLNLLLELVGQMLRGSRPRAHAAPIRFNAHGAQFPGGEQSIALGAQGVLEIYLHDWLAEPLCFVASVVAVDRDGGVQARFVHPGATVASLMEKLAFQRHRRCVAGVRQPRTED